MASTSTQVRRVPSRPGKAQPATSLAKRLLAWYDLHRRVLPWRAPAGTPADPYRVWLSEIMLQQTTVVAVAPYFKEFLARWPDLASLAAADLDAVLHAWQGLGYYARARNLHACARAVVERHGGKFPDDEAALRALPGIGAYTAAAIAAIAFGRKATAMDGNVERVIARLHAVETPLPDAKPALYRLAAALTPADRAGDYAQALMDLGSTICSKHKPKCILCPWREACLARQKGIAEMLPARREKAERPLRRGVAFWAVRGDGAILLRRRSESGLLGGMMEVPSTEWRAEKWTIDAAREAAPLPARWRPLPGIVRHGFTHFELEITVLAGTVRRESCDGVWVALDRLGDYALPNLMKKIVQHAIRNGATNAQSTTQERPAR
jgi:A/G-specific adenine glycosylase